MSSAWSWRRRRKEAQDSRRDSSGWVTTRLRFVFHAGRRGGGANGRGEGDGKGGGGGILVESLERQRERDDSTALLTRV